MENKGLKFIKEEYTTYCSIVLEADALEIHSTIEALLDCLTGMPEDLAGNNERHYIVNLIKALLPSKDQIFSLQKKTLKP